LPRLALPILTAALSASALSAAPPADLALLQITNLPDVVALRNAGDGTPRLFLVQQPGVIRIFDQKTNTLLTTPFLDIQDLVDDTGNEQGLLGLAFHPDYENNGYFYVNYTRDPGPGLDRTAIVRFHVSGDPNVADRASILTMLEIEQPFDNHNGGDIHFGQDGYLYIGMGDGGSADDPQNNGQNPAQLLGKMLRIDVDNIPSAKTIRRQNEKDQVTGTIGRCGLVGQYGIPTSNPFVNDANACDEIWAIGMRNPFRFSFDRLTGDLIIGDVGQNQVEEIDFEPNSSPGGRNYGWDCREGNIAHSGTCLAGTTLTDPILTYTHSLGCSVTGGFRYRGSIAGFDGTYVYADYCTGRIWFATQGTGWTSTQWQDTTLNPTTFGEDRNGELYIVNQSGPIYVFNSLQRTMFQDGFEVGNTSNWSETVQ
jgi:glucose/arabinose dehydrogenase